MGGNDGLVVKVFHPLHFRFDLKTTASSGLKEKQEKTINAIL